MGFRGPLTCKALIDRLTDQAHIITTGADSYRFPHHSTAQGQQNMKGETEKPTLSCYAPSRARMPVKFHGSSSCTRLTG